MYKKLLAFLILTLTFIAFSQQAYAFVEGQWNMNITEKISAKVNKVSSAKYTDKFSDTWTFSDDGQFAIDGLAFGTWATVKKKFAVYIDTSVLNYILTNNLIDEGFPDDTVVSITSTKASGTMKKDGTIKGTYKIVAVVSTSGKTGKLTINAVFTGVKISNEPPVGTEFTISEYFPLGQGDTWTYREDDNELTVKTVSGTENMNGTDAAKIIDEDGDYYLWSVSNGIVWYKEYDADDIPVCGWEQFLFNPPVIISDPVVSIGSVSSSATTLNQTNCTGGSGTATISYTFSIDGVENVTVPAGTFNNCLRIKGVFNFTGSTESVEMNIWLAKGVGKVKSITTEKQNGVTTEIWSDTLVSAVVGGVSY